LEPKAVSNERDGIFQLAEVPLTADSRREIWRWSALAVGALAVAGMFAVLVAASRVPGVEDSGLWPLDFFDKGLVTHVVFSFVAWFLAVFGILLLFAAHAASPARIRLAVLGNLGVLCVAASFPCLFVPAFLGGEASLNNYVPVIITPAYYAGLVLLFAGVALPAVRLLANLPLGGPSWPPFVAGMAAAAAVYLLVLAAIALALLDLQAFPLSTAFNEDLFWGSGHGLQFLNVLMIFAAWFLLSGVVTGDSGAPLVNGNLYRFAAVLVLLFSLAVPGFYFVFEPFSVEQTEAFTDLQYAFGPAALILIAGLVIGILRMKASRSPLPWGNPAFLCLVLSPSLFVVGGFFGLFVDGADTRTPAHYHGVIAAINVAFMGIFLTLILPLLDRAVAFGRLVSAQIWCFGGGQLFACIGLFLAGGYGAPRKTAGAAQGLSEIGAVAGLYMNGVGALVAVIGGILFIWTVASALLRPARR